MAYPLSRCASGTPAVGQQTMPISQNLRFRGDALPDNEFDHPAGGSIARLLRDGLADDGWTASDIDNWRDCGWSISCTRKDSNLQIILAQMASVSQWFLQIGATCRPGFVGRLLGRRAAGGPNDILALAKDVASILSREDRFTDFKWCWDGYPEDDACTSEPMAVG